MYNKMMLLHGGKKNRRRSNNILRSRRLRHLSGGYSPSPLSPALFADGGNTYAGDMNYKQTGSFSSNQVGGGYGYSTGANNGVFAGSYPEATSVCTASQIDGRGGNNILMGGKRSRNKRRGGSKRSSKKNKRRCGGSKRKGGTKKWRQKGCSTRRSRRKMRGGLILL
jgi:hypothetical protein